MSNFVVPESSVHRLVECYRKKHSKDPDTPSQLLNLIKRTDLQFDPEFSEPIPYGAMKTAFALYQASRTATPSESSPSPTAAPLLSAQEFDWEQIWLRYETVFQHAPNKPAHLWNFARDEGFVVKYKFARHAFEYLQAQRRGEEEEVDKPAPVKVEEAPAPKRPRARSLSEEDFAALFRRYRQQYKAPPRDARQLFSFAEKETELELRYGAINQGFSKWADALRAETLTSLDNTTGEADEPNEEDTGLDTRPEGSPLVASEHETSHAVAQAPAETETEAETGGVPAAAVLAVTPKGEVGLPRTMSKRTYWDEDQFLAIMSAYRQEHNGRLPKDATMLMEYANTCGHLVRYGAANRAWKQWLSKVPPEELAEEPPASGN